MSDAEPDAEKFGLVEDTSLPFAAVAVCAESSEVALNAIKNESTLATALRLFRFTVLFSEAIQK